MSAQPLRACSPNATVPVRRRGDLTLEIRNASGVPVAGALVSLRAIELDADVATWLAAGLVQSPAAELKTGVHGRIELSGLPRDGYAWELELAGGTVLSGSAVLRPGETEVVRIVVP